jgi:hypothetical protein
MKTFQQRAATVINNLNKVRTYQIEVKAAIKFVEKTLDDAQWLQDNYPEVYQLYITQREQKDRHTMRLCSTKTQYPK